MLSLVQKKKKEEQVDVCHLWCLNAAVLKPAAYVLRQASRSRY